MNTSVLSANKINAGYGSKTILQEVSIDLARGEFLAIVGPNGSGKSTLMKSLIGFVQVDSGEIRYGERQMNSLRRQEAARHVAFLPQSTTFHFPYRVFDYVLLGRRPYQGLFRSLTDEDRAAVEQAMHRTEVWNLRNRIVTELSGGERQRVVLASAFAQQTAVLLLDEPTNSLDLRHQLRVYELLSEMKEECGLAVMAVTHDLNLAALHADRIIVMSEGQIVKQGTPDAILSADLLLDHFGIESTVRVDSVTQRPYVQSHRSISI